MQKIIDSYQVQNRITTPLHGKPAYISSGIIKAVMKNGDKVSVAQIDYQEFDEENFQYVIIPYWDIIDGLPASIFQGIPGIDMELRLRRYYRVNYIPVFISERTPSENREDLWDLLSSVGLDYYDRFEWLLRTDMRAANDNLIVERRNPEMTISQYSNRVLSHLQYDDRVIVESLDIISDTSSGFADAMFSIVTTGVNIITESGKSLLDETTRSALVPYVITQRIKTCNEKAERRRAGIDKAKKVGKYTGRKPIEIDENILRSVKNDLDEGIITVEEAMKRVKLNSRSTFYRKIRAIRGQK